MKGNTLKDLTGVTAVTIPDSVRCIDTGEFLGLTRLKYVTIPSSITRIEWSAFYGCTGLISVTIPESVVHIGNCAFRLCSSLKFIIIPAIFERADDAFWIGVGINKVACQIITASDLQSFKKEEDIEGNYSNAVLTELYRIKKDANYQPSYSSLTVVAPLAEVLASDIFTKTANSRIPGLPFIKSQGDMVQLNKSNISTLIGSLGTFLAEASDALIGFLSLKDLAKISMAKLTIKSTFQAIRDDSLPITNQNRYNNQDSRSYPESRAIAGGDNIKHRFHSEIQLLNRQEQGSQPIQGIGPSISNI